MMMKFAGLLTTSICVLLLSITSWTAEQLYRPQPSVTPALANPGIHSVGVITMGVVNPRQLSAHDLQTLQDRHLTLEVWYPAQTQANAEFAIYKNVSRTHQPFDLQGKSYRNAPALGDQGKFPLVVLSHGYTGYRTMMFYLAEHLASHGYVVAAIDHSDSTNAEVDVIKSPNSGFISTLLNRARDQQFVLDFFTDSPHEIGKITDTQNVAVVGFSMGGFGAINTVGGCYGFSTEFMQGLGFPKEQTDRIVPLFNSCHAGLAQPDTRWKAMIALAPWGGEMGLHTSGSMAGIRAATLYIAGDQDDISGFENGVKKLYQQTGSAHNYLLVYENARHNIAAHPAPEMAFNNDTDLGHYYEPSWDTESINRINMHISLAFLNCYIQSDRASCAFLPEREDITQTRQENGALNAPWPGFPERWGTGVRFYRSN